MIEMALDGHYGSFVCWQVVLILFPVCPFSLQVLMPDTALVPGSPSPLAQAISRFDSDIVMTAVNRGAFNDAEGIHCVQKLAVVDHVNILVLIEHK